MIRRSRHDPFPPDAAPFEGTSIGCPASAASRAIASTAASACESFSFPSRTERSFASAAGELLLSPELAGTFLREFQRDQEVEDVRRLVHTLTPREEEVLRRVATGAKNREISQRLFISELTVKMHLASIFRKLQVNDRTKVAILALKAGLSTP